MLLSTSHKNPCVLTGSRKHIELQKEPNGSSVESSTMQQTIDSTPGSNVLCLTFIEIYRSTRLWGIRNDYRHTWCCSLTIKFFPNRASTRNINSNICSAQFIVLNLIELMYFIGCGINRQDCSQHRIISSEPNCCTFRDSNAWYSIRFESIQVYYWHSCSRIKYHYRWSG
jgi:hypothetical protein